MSQPSNSYQNKLIYPGVVISNNDIMGLNRIRVKPETQYFRDYISSVPKEYLKDDGSDLEEKYWWGSQDPFIALPLLPFFINQTPKVDEYVNLIYSNKDYKTENVYYIQGMFSSPMTTGFENHSGSQTLTAKSPRNKPTLALKKPDGSFYQDKSAGIFPEPNDVGILGRGTSDLIVRENSVVLRAGKTTNLNRNEYPLENPNRAFSELSFFKTTRVPLPPITEPVFKTQNLFVSTLVEWEILNPENQFDLFNIQISLYNLSEQKSSQFGSSGFSVTTEVLPTDRSLVFQTTYNQKSSGETVSLINGFITGVNNGELNMPGYTITPIGVPPLKPQFPFYFRPSPNTWKWISEQTQTTIPEYINVSGIFNQIKLFQSSTYVGCGLVSSKDRVGPVREFSIVSFDRFIEEPVDVTYNLQGADKLVLLSHQTAISNRGKIDLSNTMTGISQEFLVNEVIPKTDAMVRGDELMSFLGLIVNYLLNHYHSFPGQPPRPTSTDGTTAELILQEYRNHPNTILNQNIRIN